MFSHTILIIDRSSSHSWISPRSSRFIPPSPSGFYIRALFKENKAPRIAALLDPRRVSRTPRSRNPEISFGYSSRDLPLQFCRASRTSCRCHCDVILITLFKPCRAPCGARRAPYSMLDVIRFPDGSDQPIYWTGNWTLLLVA